MFQSFGLEVIKNFLQKLWDTPYQYIRTMLVVITACFFTVWYVNKVYSDAYQCESIDSIIKDQLLVDDMKALLLQVGDSSFVCRIRYEQTKEGDFFVFKDVLGLLKAKSPIPYSIADYNYLYKEVHIVDDNTKNFIRQKAPLTVHMMTDSIADSNGLAKIKEIFKRQKLPIKRFKYIIVRDSKSVIWAFTISALDNKKLNKQDGETLFFRIANQEHQRILERRSIFFDRFFNKIL